MYIIHVEDDHLQADWLHSNLITVFPNVKIEHIRTELDFYKRLDSLEQLPDVFIIDVMLRWTDPGIDMQPPPDDVKVEGFYRAGLRCERKIAAHETARYVPVILYSALERNDLEPELKTVPENVIYLTKESTLENLFQEIRNLNVKLH
jgi:CheY-like chemotaxis protein